VEFYCVLFVFLIHFLYWNWRLQVT